MILEKDTNRSHWRGRITITDMIRIKKDMEDYGEKYYYPKGFRGDLFMAILENSFWKLKPRTKSKFYLEYDGNMAYVVEWLIKKRGPSGFDGDEIYKLTKKNTSDIVEFLMPYILADKLTQ